MTIEYSSHLVDSVNFADKTIYIDGYRICCERSSSDNSIEISRLIDEFLIDVKPDLYHICIISFLLNRMISRQRLEKISGSSLIFPSSFPRKETDRAFIDPEFVEKTFLIIENDISFIKENIFKFGSELSIVLLCNSALAAMRYNQNSLLDILKLSYKVAFVLPIFDDSEPEIIVANKVFKT